MIGIRTRRAASWAMIALALAGCRADARNVTDFADEASPPELVRLVAGMMPAIERLSGLDRVDVLRMRYQDREAARRYVEERLSAEMPPERLDGARRTYVALGLLPDTLDLATLLLDLYTEQVLGYYDPGSGTLFIIEGESVESLRPVIAHELVHALQDQHTSLDSLIAPARGNDRQTAAHAAMEGHAMVVMFAVLAETATRSQVDPTTLPNPARELGPALEAQNEQFPVFRRAPAVIRETLLFPYVHGAAFVYEVWQSMSGVERYPAPLDTLLPQSTAQVLNPRERFIRGRVEPVEVEFGVVPAGWSVVYENTLGQLETSIFLAEHIDDAARVAADGWAGDRFLLLTDGTDDVLHWISLWESAAAAVRFARSAERVAEGWPARSISVLQEQTGSHAAVRVVMAPATVDPAALPVLTYTVREP
jgi:hypothetical protein